MTALMLRDALASRVLDRHLAAGRYDLARVITGMSEDELDLLAAGEASDLAPVRLREVA